MPNPANAAKAGKSGKVQVEATAVSMFPKRFKSHCCMCEERLARNNLQLPACEIPRQTKTIAKCFRKACHSKTQCRGFASSLCTYGLKCLTD